MPESLFNKVAGLRPQNTFFTEHLWKIASGILIVAGYYSKLNKHVT